MTKIKELHQIEGKRKSNLKKRASNGYEGNDSWDWMEK